jgi:DNA-binding NarL/FixJ family response regulator
VNRIRVVLADDHPIVRDGLKLLFEYHPDIELVAEAGDGAEVLQILQKHCVDIAILDIGMPVMNGIDCAVEIKKICPYTQIIMLSIHGTSEYVVRAIQAGATGYLLKDSLGKEIIRAIHTVLDGQYILSKKIAEKLLLLDVDVHTISRERSPLANLSTQEQKVLQYVVAGLSSSEIAGILYLSQKTVETYRSRLMTKLGVENMTELIKFAIIHGLIYLDT